MNTTTATKGAIAAATVVIGAIAAIGLVRQSVDPYGKPETVTPVPSVAIARDYAPNREPNLSLSPGVALPVTAKDVCAPGYAKSVRNVPESEKAVVYREYGLDPKHHEPTEIDHLESLENGGSNDIRNLFPEPYAEPWGAHTKDRYENFIHAQICAGKMTIEEGQNRLAHDWIANYKADLGNPYTGTAPTRGNNP